VQSLERHPSKSAPNQHLNSAGVAGACSATKKFPTAVTADWSKQGWFMLFNSYVFIFAFLPVVMLGFYLIGRSSHALAALWVAAASMFFYGWWDVRYVGLLLGPLLSTTDRDF
jgi:hypothetical protein